MPTEQHPNSSSSVSASSIIGADSPSPAKARSGYLPSLDGWRAIAILSVLFAHDTSWGHTANIPEWQQWGGLGVNLFFAISGILITTRILEEERLSGFFDIRGFYTRRVLRIQPAAFMYLAVLAALMLSLVVHNQWRYWVASLLMYVNFLWDGSFASLPTWFFFNQFWSLAVEEHFYLLLSLFLLFVRRRRLTYLLVALVVLKAVRAIATHSHTDINPFATYWQLGYLVLPAAIAVALQRQDVRAWCCRWLQPGTIFTLSALVPFAEWARITHLHHVAGASLAIARSTVFLYSSIFFPLWIVATMLHAGSWSTRALEWKPLRWIGKISYSLYLWHILFFFRATPHVDVTQPLLLALSGRPMKYIAAFGAAALSYYIIELPCMRLGHRLAKPRLAGRPELATPSADIPTATSSPVLS